jgi:DNA polymerase I-like protein with 3'-5' exonuclease and polymerase domains
MDGVPALRKLKEHLAKTLQENNWLRGLDKRILYCRSDFKALNVLLQSAGALIMKQVVINIHTDMDELGYVHGVDWQQAAMIHDEVQLACKPELTDVLKAVALDAFPKAQHFFNFRCPIDGDAKVGYTWFDTH